MGATLSSNWNIFPVSAVAVTGDSLDFPLFLVYSAVAMSTGELYDSSSEGSCLYVARALAPT